MRRTDREEPGVQRAMAEAERQQLLKRFDAWQAENLADCRQAKAALPDAQYQAFVVAAEERRAAILAGMEIAGQSVSKMGRVAAAASISNELAIIANLRAQPNQQGMEFAEGDVAGVFGDS